MKFQNFLRFSCGTICTAISAGLVSVSAPLPARASGTDSLFASSWISAFEAPRYSFVEVSGWGAKRSQAIEDIIVNGSQGDLGSSNFLGDLGGVDATAKVRIGWGVACALRARGSREQSYDFGEDFAGTMLGVSAETSTRMLGAACTYGYQFGPGTIHSGAFIEGNWIDASAKYQSAPRQLSEREESGFGISGGSMMRFQHMNDLFDVALLVSTGLEAELEGTASITNVGFGSAGSLDSAQVKTIKPPQLALAATFAPTQRLSLNGSLRASLWNQTEPNVYSPLTPNDPQPFFTTQSEDLRLEGQIGLDYALTPRLRTGVRVGVDGGATDQGKLLFPDARAFQLGAMANFAATDRIAIRGSVETEFAGGFTGQEAGHQIEFGDKRSFLAGIRLRTGF